MPKHRRRKNQRFLDNKSRINSQLKQKQQREQVTEEKEQLEDDVSRTEDDDIESLDAGCCEISSEPRCQDAHVETEEEVVSESGDDVPCEIISVVESAIDSATNHASGTMPNDANVPGDTLCPQQPTPSTTEDAEAVIENSDISMARGRDADTTILDSAIGRSAQSVSQISSIASNTILQKIDCGLDLENDSPRSSSPDRQIINNENATICDITTFTDTTTTQETSKARLEGEHFLNCDNANEGVLIEASSSTELSDKFFNGAADPIELCKHDAYTVISTSNTTSIIIDDQLLEDISDIHRKNEAANESTLQEPACSSFETAELSDNYENPANNIAPIRHPIVQEVVTILYPSRVESPKPMTTKRSAAGPLMKSKSLDDDDIMIQEMSDGSSTGDMTDNQPLISEASESGTDTDTGPPDFEERIDPRILSVQTLPLQESLIETTENDDKSVADDEIIRGEISQDTKARRARNRAALEIHFMPQFLNPRYLDSIKEENSDASDLESKSPVRERSISMGDLEDDVFVGTSKERRASAPSTPKADSVFPKSSLDFSQKHKHLSNLRSPQTTIIREESPCYAVETKLIEPPEAVEERCSEWTTKHVEQSTDAVEVVYIDSASSSSSSLNELDYTDSTITNGSYEDDSSETVHIETPTIESYEDGANIFGDLEKTPTREMPNVMDTQFQRSRLSDIPLQQIATEEPNLYELSDTRLQQIATEKSDIQDVSLAFRDGSNEQPKHFLHSDKQQQPANNNTAKTEATITTITTAATEDRSHRSSESSRPEDFSAPTDTQLNQKRLSLNANAGQSAVEREILEYSSEYKQEVLIHPDFKIGEPCSNNMFATSLSPLVGSRNNTSEEIPSSLSTPVTPVFSTDALNKAVSEDNSANRGELVRQDSSGSHCSAQSQNTVINRGSSNEFVETEFTYRTILSFSPQDLRQLCLEKLACMPYGKVVLEELASVSEALNDLTEKHQQDQVLKIQNLKDIKEMPYPRPELPNISDLIVPKRPEDPNHVKLMMAPPSKQLSPPPPPVPKRPSVEDTWLGIPTDEHPNVLVCLSPAQRNYINSTKQAPKSRPEPTPDTLLDMHQKFVERRGYHELASDVVEKIDRAQSTAKKLDQIVSSPQLNQNTSPPPIPPPPLYEPQTQLDEIQTTGMTSKKSVTVKAQTGSFNGGGDRVITLDDLDDKNNHRLLAIIRNSQQPLSSVKESTQEKVDQHVTSTSSQSVQYEEKLGQSRERLPPEVPPRFSTSDIRSQGTANCAPHSNAPTPSEMSSTTSTSFSDTPWTDHHHHFGSTDFQKRFSNIEHKSPFCSQILQTQPKRYSNIETTTTTSKKRIENGNVVYDISDTQKEKVTSGDDLSAGKTPAFRNPPSSCSDNKTRQTEMNNSRTSHEKVSEQHDSSATKTFSQLFENRTELGDLHKPTTTPLQQKQNNFAYDEFRQRAKESAAERAKSEFLERQDFLLKDFDELTKLIKDDLFLSDSKTTEKSTSQTTETIEKSKFTRVDGSGGTQGGSSYFGEKHGEVKDLAESKKHKSYNIPVRLENFPTNQQLSNSFENRTMHQTESKEQTVHKERTIPIRIEKPLNKEISNMSNSMGSLPTTPSKLNHRERHLSERRLSSQNLDEWMRYINLGASSENITKPLQKEVELCAFGRHPNIRAPRLTSTDTKEKLSTRLSQSTSNLSTIGTESDHLYTSHHFGRTNSLVDTSPISPFVTSRNPRQRSVPKEINDSQLAYIRQKESELRDEFDKLEQDRRRLIEEMDQVHQRNRLRKDMYFHQSCRLPTLSEEEAFRQQMHDEWLDKVAEREERRLHKIVKISGTSNDLSAPQVPSRNASMKKAASTTNISDEFLHRVKERRSKLCMPSDSDWESGAESQPLPRNRKDKTPPQVKVIEGQSERDFKNLPPHLREFAEITNQIIKEHYHPESGHRNANKDTNDPSRKEGVYQLKNEYMSEPESENDRPKKMAQLARRQFDGIGPMTKDGMPIVLRSEVKENNQHQWYKKMYNTLHKTKPDDDYVTIRYKTHRGRLPFKSSGYMSEPEPNYDSDYSMMKYYTLDRRRVPSTGSYQEERNYGTMPNPVRPSQGSSYRNQPGKIENYVPGHSSVSEKEKKEWWDEVMDIFNGNLEQQKLSSNYTEGYLSRALKEGGYESDSNLVFRKRENSESAPLSPIEQKQAYRSVQAGGEPPLQGFRKQAPEKPKESDVSIPPPPPPPMKNISLNSSFEANYREESPRRYVEGDVNIHYKSPIRYEYKDAIPDEELGRKQAESMKKLYQEERRRKYLQELEDMNNRRHTDNFIPSQKSPIALNRYDDFPTDVSPKSPSATSNLPNTVARALYNFQGQTARELSFKKGDVIYIRRQIDKNWYEGEHNAMIGLLPVNYVEIITKDGNKPPPQRKPSEGQARAKYTFQAQSAIELSLNKGELVTLTRRVDGNWFEGKIANRKGIFPVSYVDVLTDIGTEDAIYSSTGFTNSVASKPLGPTTRTIITTTTNNTSPSLDELRTSLNNEFNHLTNGGQHPNGILRETKTTQKTEVLHVDTNSEPIAYRALYKYLPQNNDELELFEGDVVYVLEKCDDGWFVGTSERTGQFGTFPGNYVERA